MRKALPFVAVSLALIGCGFPHYEFPPPSDTPDATSDGKADASTPSQDAAPDGRQCASSDDCTGSSTAHLCNIEAGRCVQCIPGQDGCPFGLYCDESGTCTPGCGADKDCIDPSPGVADAADREAGVAPALTCSTGVNRCIGCNADSDCPPSSTCEVQSKFCRLGCTTDHACAMGSTCCDGNCTVGTQCPACAPGLDDCNRIPADGCETPLNTVRDCGKCGQSCTSYPHMSAACEQMTCMVGPCDTGYKDCNNWMTDGCETSVDADPNNCGDCNIQCVNPHGSTSCGSSKCKPVCDLNWSSCSNDPSAGCTIDLMNDKLNCGMCGHACKGGNCIAGTCECPDVAPAPNIACTGSWTCGPYSGSGDNTCSCFCVNRLTTCRVGGPDGSPC